MPLAGTCHSDRMSSGKGMNWCHAETLELLALWGEEAVQEELSHNNKNNHIFRKISEGLASKGFLRTPEQCRNKSKDMKMRYKRAVAQNERSGAAHQTCPYCQELNRILHGRVSATGRRLSIPSPSQQSLPASLPEVGENSTQEGDQETPLTQETEEGAEYPENNGGYMEDLPPLEGTSTSTQPEARGSPPPRDPKDHPRVRRRGWSQRARVLPPTSSEEEPVEVGPQEAPAAAGPSQPPGGAMTISSGGNGAAGGHQASQSPGPVLVPSGDTGEGAPPAEMEEGCAPQAAGSLGSCRGCRELEIRLQRHEERVTERFHQIVELLDQQRRILRRLRRDVDRLLPAAEHGAPATESTEGQ